MMRAGSNYVCPVVALYLAIGTFGQSERSAPESSAKWPNRPTVMIHPAPLILFRGANSAALDQPGDTDSNSPLHWDGELLYLFNSAGHPWRTSGPDLFNLNRSYLKTRFDRPADGGRWIESTWKVPNGPLYGWYHYEPRGVCPGTSLTAPKIGAARSFDNGEHWEDLGIVLEASTGSLNCNTPNKYFAGGNGDFCVILDQKNKYLYFFISTYAGDPRFQGVAMARMKWSDRDSPVGKVWKWSNTGWTEPGLGGVPTPFLPVRRDWHSPEVDAFWGPSVHWNTHLRQYVMLLNRAKDSSWSQEGIYVSFNPDMGNPSGWSPPAKILSDLGAEQWYPQVVGINAKRRETDKLAGARARLFVRGQSAWEIEFRRPRE
ncbi:MAG: hypothetical protein N3G20_10700 [Verrucomicrobiae bacterium]|nr:hypothetical protein [Verrucomicrobiae bacterium]